jgi:hypothetical protein
MFLQSTLLLQRFGHCDAFKVETQFLLFVILPITYKRGNLFVVLTLDKI